MDIIHFPKVKKIAKKYKFYKVFKTPINSAISPFFHTFFGCERPVFIVRFIEQNRPSYRTKKSGLWRRQQNYLPREFIHKRGKQRTKKGD